MTAQKEKVMDPLLALHECYLADPVELARSLECSIAEAAAEQVVAAQAALPYLDGDEQAEAMQAIARAEALSKSMEAPQPLSECAGEAPEAV